MKNVLGIISTWKIYLEIVFKQSKRLVVSFKLDTR